MARNGSKEMVWKKKIFTFNFLIIYMRRLNLFWPKNFFCMKKGGNTHSSC
jgi:hypothetical protein